MIPFKLLYETLFKGGGTEAPGSLAKGFPTVHKTDSRYVPHMKGKPSKWQVAFPGGMEFVEWFTADNPNEKLHPQKTPEGTLNAIGKTESGRKFKMEFRKAPGYDKLCPYDPETWEPVNIRGGDHRSSGKEIGENTLNEALADVVKDSGEYVFISPSGKEVLRVNDLKRAREWKMYYMRKKRWKFKGRADADF